VLWLLGWYRFGDFLVLMVQLRRGLVNSDAVRSFAGALKWYQHVSRDFALGGVFARRFYRTFF